MDNIADKLNYLQDTKLAIKNAINGKGGTINSTTPFRDYADSIELIEGGGSTPSTDKWVRPSDRPPLPFNDVENGTDLPINTIYMLYGVKPNNHNDYAIQFKNGNPYVPPNMYLSTVTTDWGDGTIETLNVEETTGALCEHVYNYDNINVIPNEDGIKWIWIKFNPENSISTININAVPTGKTECVSSVYEIYANVSGIRTLGFVLTPVNHYPYLERFYYYNSGLYYLTYFLSECYNLKDLKIINSSRKVSDCSYFLNKCYSFNQRLNIDTSDCTNFTYFLTDCYSFNQPLDINTSKGTNFSYFLRYCSKFNNSLNINTSEGTNFSYFLGYCNLFNQPLNIDTSKGTSFIGFMYYNHLFNQPLNLNTSNATNISAFLTACYSFNQLLDVDTSKCTNVSTFLSNCYSYDKSINLNLLKVSSGGYTLNFNTTKNYNLSGLHLLNMGSHYTAVNIWGCNFSTNALINLFNDLYDRSSTTAGTIYITNTPGASSLTPEQRAIATSKNWTIVE